MPPGDVRKADAATYARVFENHHEGVLILEDLVARFGGVPYVKGGLEAERETLVRMGANRVVSYIVTRINQANGVQDNADQDSTTGAG